MVVTDDPTNAGAYVSARTCEVPSALAQYFPQQRRLLRLPAMSLPLPLRAHESPGYGGQHTLVISFLYTITSSELLIDSRHCYGGYCPLRDLGSLLVLHIHLLPTTAR